MVKTHSHTTVHAIKVKNAAPEVGSAISQEYSVASSKDIVSAIYYSYLVATYNYTCLSEFLDTKLDQCIAFFT